MDVMQCGQLLARIQVHDNRRVDELVIEEWFELIQHLEYPDALKAVREHRSTSTEYLTVGHVIAGAKRISGVRRMGIDNGWVPDADPDDPVAYALAIRTGRFRDATEGVTRALPSFRAITKAIPCPTTTPE